MKPSHIAIVLALGTICIVPEPGHAQGTFQTIHITFDGPPPQPPGTGKLIQRYDEAGMSFGAPPGSVGFGRRGGARDGFPENGSTYLQAGVGMSLMFSFTNGTSFDMFSVDLAELTTLFQEPLTVHFVGYRADGSTITADLTTDGVIDGTEPLADFETFYFGSEWNGLVRVEIPTYGWSLDNLVVTVPEPSACALLVSGGLLFGLMKQRRKAKRPLVECASPCP